MNNMAIGIEEVLEKNTLYRDYLFCRGYLVTDNNNLNFNIYPFYGNWNVMKVEKYQIITHNKQNCYKYKHNNITMVLIGHAYDPFEMISSEYEILVKLCESYNDGVEEFHQKLSDVTGCFALFIIQSGKLHAYQDACGMKTIYYGKVNSNLYLTSHCQLVADICNLSMNKNIEKMLNAKFYTIGNPQLCGIDSPYSEIKLLTANTYLDCRDMAIHRFYPLEDIKPYDTNTLSNIEQALQNSMELCSQKWNCRISMTGGVDSKMTFAAANGIYGKFEYFSFISNVNEGKDAKAAHEICEAFNLKHDVLDTSDDKYLVLDYEIIQKLLNHNLGYIFKCFNESECRKIITLIGYMDNKVEIKSHVSEVGRAFYYKKTGKKSFKRPLPVRSMSNFAKRNMFNRGLLHKMDKSFEEFIKVSNYRSIPQTFDETDMFYWENRMPAWAALVKQSFDISHETTIIYNNRRILEMFLRFPIEARIADKYQLQIVKDMNSKLYNLNISIDNAMKGKRRVYIERIFYELNSFF